MTSSSYIKFISTSFIFFVLMFFASVSSAAAATISGPSGCIIDAGQSTCRISNIVVGGSLSGNYDLYNYQSGVTTPNAFVSPYPPFGTNIGQPASVVGYGKSTLSLRSSGSSIDLDTFEVETFCVGGSSWVNNACSGSSSGVSAAAIALTQAQIDQLKLAIAAVSTAVLNSPTLLEAQKIVLVQQIIAISTQILELEKSIRPIPLPPAKATTPTPAVSENLKESAKRANLNRIDVTFATTTDEATIRLSYSSGVAVKKIILQSVLKAPDFNAKMEALRIDLAKELSNSEKIFERDIKDLMFISARDPVRDGYITRGSKVAEEMAENFARHSIINEIIVKPNDHFGDVSFITNQGETVNLSIKQKSTSNNVQNSITYIDEYEILFEYYATTSRDDVVTDPNTNISTVLPKATKLFDKVDPLLLIDNITSLFSRLPFTTKIPNFGTKFANFLVKNTNTFVANRVIPYNQTDCYYTSDKAIMNGFLSYLIDGVGSIQNEPVDSIIVYSAPVIPDPNGLNYEGCYLMNRMF